jgi:hypothetical protein
MPGDDTLSSRDAPATVPVTMMARMISIWRNVSICSAGAVAARFFCIVLKAAAPASDLRLSMSGMGQKRT